ncbi:MAG: hypothetical protein IMZ43_09715 [Thermoplasmata archaeon]|nr:hypothetical protein [Thermoplasmata archaeon]
MALIRDDFLKRTMEGIDRQRSAKRSEDERRRKEEEDRAEQIEKENEHKRNKKKASRRQVAKAASNQVKADALRFLHPNVALSRGYTGDRDLSTLYRGESDKLLYQLKNLMQFRQLGQLKMTRLFTDGTVITAWSIFGQDFVNIDVSRMIPIGELTYGIAGECTVTFIDLPVSVQPMRYPGQIKAEEIEGIDYIKTYYSYDISRCSDCNDQSEFTFEFTFDEPPGIQFFEGNILITPPILPDPENHCIVSLDGGCRGEVIDQGEDANGKYIRWKVYTEGQYNRSGLAGVRVTASVKDQAGTVKCSVQLVVMVDCCLRSDLLKPEIYWEFYGEDCIAYGGTLLCKVPSLISLGLFSWYASGESGWAARYYALPEVGGCPPYEWTISGPGSLYKQHDIWSRMVTYLRPLGGEINGDVTISVTDRCGRSDSFRASCCEFATPLTIGYTSLSMSCSGNQTLTANGGCAPYSWGLSGGGTLEPGGSGNNQAIYTAPATNPNCTSNPTITLIDNCGSSSSIKLAVSCYTAGGVIRKCDFLPCSHECIFAGGACHYHGTYGVWRYDCLGVLDYSTFLCYSNIQVGSFSCSDCAGTGWGCAGTWPQCGTGLANCPGSGCAGGDYPCFAGNILCANPYQACGTIADLRTTAQKEGGCCPINPLTGLPY